MAVWQGINAPAQRNQISGFKVVLLIEKMNQIILKTIGNRKKKTDCAWGYARGINTTWENLQIEKHKSGRRSFRSTKIASKSFFSSKKGIKLVLKNIGNRKGDCAWSCLRWQTQPEKICKIAKHKSVSAPHIVLICALHIADFFQVLFVTSNNFRHNLLFYFQ